MQKKFQKWALALAHCGLLFVLPFFMTNARTATTPAKPLSCLAPGVSVINQGSNFVTFGLETPADACQYYYVRKDNNASSGVMSTSNSTVTISGLAPGTYDFYFRSVCEGNETSEYIISELLLM